MRTDFHPKEATSSRNLGAPLQKLAACDDPHAASSVPFERGRIRRLRFVEIADLAHPLVHPVTQNCILVQFLLSPNDACPDRTGELTR
jgi:hypothetical protein